MLFKKQKPYCEVGTIIKKLGMRRICFGERRWEWLNSRERFIFGPGSRLNPHICIIGTSGSGKSNACKIIMRAVANSGARFAILDPHGEYASFSESMGASIYDALRSGINIFELDGMSEREKASELVAMLKRTFRLGEVQGYTLYKCLMYTYRICREKGASPGIKGLLFTMKVFMKNADTREKRILEGLEKRISLLDTAHSSSSCSMQKMLSENSVIILSNLHTPEAQSVYIEGFLRKIYTTMLSMQKSGLPRFYVVIDEAAKVRGSDILARIAAEGRKYGFGIIALSQTAKEMDKGLRANSAVFASFYQREPEELNYMASFMSGGAEGSRYAEVKKGLRMLRQGCALVLDSSKREPIIVRFDEAKEINSDALSLVLSIKKPAMSMNELLLQFSNSGHSKEECKDAIEIAVRNRLLFGFLLENCGTYSGMWYVKTLRNSPEHDVSVNVIARKLQENGILCRIYNSTNGPDIIAGNNECAIEYETGSKATASTKEMISKRRLEYKNILIVTNDSFKSRYSDMAETFSMNEFSAMDKEHMLSALHIFQGEGKALDAKRAPNAQT